MAQDKQLSPEKELLNLIEKPMAQSSLQAATVKYHNQSLVSPGALKGRLAFLQNKFQDLWRKRDFVHQLDIGVLNQALKAGVIILGCYFCLNLFTSINEAKKDIHIAISEERAVELNSARSTSILKAVSYYLEKARERDIFKMGLRAPVPGTGIGARGPSEKVLEATQNLRLVGIAWSDDPDVMIEDTKLQRTLFLKKGQRIDNLIELKAVFKDKVVLSFQGEEIELK